MSEVIRAEIRNLKYLIDLYRSIVSDREFDLLIYSFAINGEKLPEDQLIVANKRVEAIKNFLEVEFKEHQTRQARLELLEKILAAETEEVAA